MSPVYGLWLKVMRILHNFLIRLKYSLIILYTSQLISNCIFRRQFIDFDLFHTIFDSNLVHVLGLDSIGRKKLNKK